MMTFPPDRSEPFEPCFLFQRARLKKAVLSKALPENNQRQDYLRGDLETAPDGQLGAVPLAQQDSSLMRGLADARCLIIRPPFAPPAEAGSPCEVLVLRRSGARLYAGCSMGLGTFRKQTPPLMPMP